MDLVTRDDLKALLDAKREISASIFMPAHPVGREMQQDPLRLKNLLNEAEEKLVEAGLRAPVARKMLAPARALLDDNDFWQHQSNGLALFIGPDSFHSYRVPLDFDELVVVADRFHVKPLLPLLSVDGQFYILALSQNDVRMFLGSRFSVGKVELEDVPTSLAETLAFDVVLKQQQFHTKTSQRPGNRSAIFHGQGASGDDDQEEKLFRYFRQIDDGLQPFLQQKQAPLVLAGVEYLFPIYREANTYAHLLDEGIEGNPETLRPAELHQRAWPIVEPHFRKNQEESIGQYQALLDTDRASNDLRQILPAAYYGQIDTLFTAVELQQWGTFDSDTNTLELHDSAQPGDKDLLDSAAVQTLLHDGTVYAMPQDQIPDGAPLAAIFRYAA